MDIKSGDSKPIVIDENGNLLMFGSRAAAEGYLEPIDVANKEYVGYDADGRLLNLSVVRDHGGSLLGRVSGSTEAVKLSLAESAPTHATELRDKLLRSLKDTDLWRSDLPDLPLERIVALGLERFKIR